MKVTACTCLAAISGAVAFVAPSSFSGTAVAAPRVASRSSSAAPVRMGADDLGAIKPLGYWDPLGMSKNIDGVDRRWRQVEIKHGRIAMLATIGFLVPYVFMLPFPGGQPGVAALSTVPPAGLLQIFAFIGALELWVFWQTPDREPGDVAPEWSNWKRYEDDAVRERKLNVELSNGRLAMVAIMGMLVQDSLPNAPFPGI